MDSITEYSIGKHSIYAQLSNFTPVSVCILIETAFSCRISYSEAIHETWQHIKEKVIHGHERIKHVEW